MGVKQTQDVPSSLPQDQLEGVADEEWVGHVTIRYLPHVCIIFLFIG